MNALVLANRLPFPLDDGWKVRSWHVIEAVASVMPVTLAVARPDDPGLLEAARTSFSGPVDIVTFRLGRRNSPWRALAGLVTPWPVLYWNQQSRDAHRQVRQAVETRRFSVGIAVLTYLYPYLRHLAPGARRIVDTHNVDSANMDRYVATLPAGPRRAYAALTARKLRRLESRVFAAADETWVCSDEDARAVRRAVGQARVAVVPNGVDTTRFAPAPRPPVPGRLLFFGRLDYFPNREAIEWFVREMLPEIRRAVPEAHLEVVGQGAEPALAALLATSPGARLHGPVTDVPAALAEASVVVVPLRAGGGTRLKILEALGAARPVVSTTVGAEGLDLTPGKDLLLADDAAAFAAAVTGLLRHPEQGARLGAAGRETVRRRYDWALVRAQVAGLLAPAGVRAG